MKKLYTMLVAIVLVVMMGMTSLAATYYAGGLYRPYGYTIIDRYGQETTSWVDSYNLPINITYIDNNTLIGSIDNEAVTMACSDPVGHPNIYCTYYTGTSIVFRGVKITDNNTLMYFINRPDLNTKYYSEYILMQ